jgi:hypothetical protein
MKTNHPRTGRLGAENRPSPQARKRLPRETEFSDAERRLAQIIRQTYIDDRTAWETMRRGVAFTYVPPLIYDEGKKGISEEAAAEIKDRRKREAAKRRVPSVWLELATKFIHRRLDPEEFIHRMFERSDKSRPPEPGQLLDEKFIEEYDNVLRAEHSEVADSLKVQKQLAASHILYWQHAGMNFVSSHATVLLDEDLDLSALFRMCLAYGLMDRDKVFKKIVKEYMGRAAVQFERSRREYRRTWGDFIPVDFVKRSRRLYEEALGHSDVTGGWSGEDEEEG